MIKDQLAEYLSAHIPIAAAMGVQVVDATRDKVTLLAPCLNNINHKRTVFGGSLHAIATLACWSLVHVNLHPGNATPYHIVIAHSEVTYHHPVDADFVIECAKPEAAAWDRFLKILHAKGKGRIRLSAQLHHNGKLCVDYNADFAALKA